MIVKKLVDQQPENQIIKVTLSKRTYNLLKDYLSIWANERSYFSRSHRSQLIELAILQFIKNKKNPIEKPEISK